MKGNRQFEQDLSAAFEPVRKIAARLDLPELVEGVWYGTPSLKVRRKSPLRMKDADTLVILCPLEDKAMLMEAAPDIYFETDHYKGWPAVLVRLPAISNEELRHRLERAWRAHAP